MYRGTSECKGCSLHVVLKLLQVLLLLSKLLLQLQQLFLLALTDRVVLVGLLALGEGVASVNSSISMSVFSTYAAIQLPISMGHARKGRMMGVGK